MFITAHIPCSGYTGNKHREIYDIAPQLIIFHVTQRCIILQYMFFYNV